MVYYFQNPNSGYPMYLTEDLVVEVEDLEGATNQDLRDARSLTQVVRKCKDVHEAAELLYREHSCKDILT